MKRTVQFKPSENGYGCFENDVLIFEISDESLQFDVKQFYQAFYSNRKEHETIELQNLLESDSNGNRIYQCLSELIDKISQKLDEFPNDKDDDYESTIVSSATNKN